MIGSFLLLSLLPFTIGLVVYFNDLYMLIE